MALFGSKKKKETDVAKVAKTTDAKSVSKSVPSKDVIMRPRVTEKAANLTSNNVYTFDIRLNATKEDVKNAVKALYKVTPVKIHVVNVSAKRVRLRAKRGFGAKPRTRKAYVFLKKGDSITLA